MRVFLTGADGYIGAIMGPKLIEAGHEVVGLDTGFYRRGWLFDDGRTHPAVISQRPAADHRRRPARLRRGGAPGRALQRPDRRERPRPDHGDQPQGLGRRWREKARAAGVARFIQASSCSTYGAGGDEMRTETSALAPQTAYARCKILVEERRRAR